MAQKTTWKEHYWFTIPVMRKRIELLIEAVEPKGKSIVEVGCNEGFLSKAFLEHGASRVVPVDYDQSMVNKARHMFGVDAIKADINKLPFEDDEFDIAVGGEVLEHIMNPMVGLQELFRVARERVVLSLPVGPYWLGELTHQWELGGRFVNHDTLAEYRAEKDILILSWTRRRDGTFKDIPPFSTAKHKKEYGL